MCGEDSEENVLRGNAFQDLYGVETVLENSCLETRDCVVGYLFGCHSSARGMPCGHLGKPNTYCLRMGYGGRILYHIM